MLISKPFFVLSLCIQYGNMNSEQNSDIEPFVSVATLQQINLQVKYAGDRVALY